MHIAVEAFLKAHVSGASASAFLLVAVYTHV